MNIKNTLIATALLLSINSAQAALVETDWKNTGDALATLDTETGIEWLDLNLTTNTSLSEMNTQLDNTYLGWRFPTKQEVNDLADKLFPTIDFAHSGTTTTHSAPSYSEDSQRFLSLFGTNYLGDAMFGIYHAGSLTNHDASLVFGLYENRTIYDDCSGCSPRHAQNGIFLVSDGGTTQSSQLDPSLNANNANYVAKDVSAPALLGLMGLGLFGLAARRRSSVTPQKSSL
jgi:hypothetical protein